MVAAGDEAARAAPDPGQHDPAVPADEDAALREAIRQSLSETTDGKCIPALEWC